MASKGPEKLCVWGIPGNVSAYDLPCLGSDGRGSIITKLVSNKRGKQRTDNRLRLEGTISMQN